MTVPLNPLSRQKARWYRSLILMTVPLSQTPSARANGSGSGGS